jgi:hypothetical protein
MRFIMNPISTGPTTMLKAMEKSARRSRSESFSSLRMTTSI